MLPLRCYDLIVGEDWLEEFSPMLIDYKLKTMQLSYQGKTIHLQGLVDNPIVCTPVSAHKLKGLLKHGVVTHYCAQMIVHAMPSDRTDESSNEQLPAAVSLLEKYNHLFFEPTGLPQQFLCQ